MRARLRRTSGPGKRLAGEHAAPREQLPAGRVSVARIACLQRLAMRGRTHADSALAGICCSGSVPGASAASGERPGSLMVVVWPGPLGSGWTQGSAAHKLGSCWWHNCHRQHCRTAAALDLGGARTHVDVFSPGRSRWRSRSLTPLPRTARLLAAAFRPLRPCDSPGFGRHIVLPPLAGAGLPVCRESARSRAFWQPRTAAFRPASVRPESADERGQRQREGHRCG